MGKVGASTGKGERRGKGEVERDEEREIKMKGERDWVREEEGTGGLAQGRGAGRKAESYELA